MPARGEFLGGLVPKIQPETDSVIPDSKERDQELSAFSLLNKIAILIEWQVLFTLKTRFKIQRTRNFSFNIMVKKPVQPGS